MIVRHELLPVFGRLFLAAIFLISGLSKIAQWDQSLQSMASQGVPFASILLFLATAIEIAGGLSLLLGYRCRAGAWMLALYLIPVTLVFHDFWALDGPDRVMQQIQFLKNLAIFGGLLEASHIGAGAYSVDRARTPTGRSGTPPLDQRPGLRRVS